MDIDKYIETYKRLKIAFLVVGVVAVVIAKGAFLVHLEEIRKKFHS